MLMAATAQFLHAFAVLARRADSGLAETAARNAAVVVAERGMRRLEDARTMRDLARLGFTDESGGPAGEPPRFPGEPTGASVAEPVLSR